MEERIIFTTDEGEEVAFYIVEETTLAGENYLLVAEADEDTDDEEADALILKETKGEDGEEVVYEVVEDDAILEALSKVFAELLDDVDIEL